MADFREEFPDYPADLIPTLGDGWRDTSWRNEPCPSFIHDESGVVLWCGWPIGSPEREEDAPAYQFVQIAQRCPVNGWQYGPDDSTVLQCDNIGEVRDVLDSLPYLSGLPDALRDGRMRLNQLTSADACALFGEELQHGLNGGRACPDLKAEMRAIWERDPHAVTLDGEPARLCGLGDRFGFVCRADGKGGNVEFSLAAIARVMINGGAFQS